MNELSYRSTFGILQRRTLRNGNGFITNHPTRKDILQCHYFHSLESIIPPFSSFLHKIRLTKIKNDAMDNFSVDCFQRWNYKVDSHNNIGRKPFINSSFRMFSNDLNEDKEINSNCITDEERNIVNDMDEDHETKQIKEMEYMNEFIENTHMFPFMNEAQLEKQVQGFESLSISESEKMIWPDSFLSAIYPLMENCARLNSVRGAKLTERILARCIVESSSFNQQHHIEIEKDIDSDMNDISYPNKNSHIGSLSSLSESNSDSSLDLESLAESLENEKAFPTSEMYNVAIDAWGKSNARRGYGARRAEQILNLMIAEYVQNMHLRREALFKFQQRKNRASLEHKDSHNKYTADENYDDQSTSSSASLSSTLFPVLSKPVAKPDAINYAATMAAWKRSGQKDTAKQVQRIFDQMQIITPNNQRNKNNLNNNGNSKAKKNTNYNISVEPDTVCFNTVMSTWSQSKEANSSQKVQELFITLMNLYEQTKQPQLKPSKYTYSVLMDSYARSLSSSNTTRPSPTEIDNIIHRVETLIETMQNEYKTNRDSVLQPDTVTYNAFLNVLARAGKPQRAELFLDHMITMQAEAYAAGDMDLLVKPNTRSYNTIINGWACAASEESGQQAERILTRMKQDYDDDVRPTVITYNSVINAHIKSGATNAAENAKRILDHMIVAHLDNPIEELDGYLSKEIVQMYLEDIAVRDKTIPKPNIITFGTVIHAWSLSPNPKAAHYAESLLNQMEKLHQSRQLGHLMPNTRCYQGVITSFRNNNNAEKAEDILLRLYDTSTSMNVDGQYHYGNTHDINKPNIFLYNIVLSAWVNDDKSHPNQKAKRAQALLQWMEQLSQKEGTKGESSYISDVSPNVDSYNLVIEVCANANANANTNTNTNTNANPNPNLTASINQSNHNEIQSDMNIRKEAFFIAIQTFNALCDRATQFNDNMKHKENQRNDNKLNHPNHPSNHRKHKPKRSHTPVGPNSDTYKHMLHMISSLLPANRRERLDLAQKLFLECCSDGLVNNDVLNAFKDAVTEDVFLSCMRSLRGDDRNGMSPSTSTVAMDHLDFESFGTNDLPPKCCCNI